jgi:H+/gluconate symporter-like permease
MSVIDTMKTWSVTETLISIIALLLTLAVAAVV